MTPGDQCFRGYGRRNGERRRKGVRGCIVTPGLSDKEIPKLRGPKRASTIRKLFALSKDDDVRKYVVLYRSEKNGAPKIQRLIAPTKQQRKRRVKALKAKKIAKAKSEAASYAKKIAKAKSK